MQAIRENSKKMKFFKSLCLNISLFLLIFEVQGNIENWFSEAYDDGYYDCSAPLIRGAALKATTEMRTREADKAVLNEGSAWTARSSDFVQYLSIDLGEPMDITKIATQGRQFSSEYVSQYQISYGTNGLDYMDYKDTTGSPKLFKGNSDSNTVVYNKFDPPIKAQWIRINPTRWRERISLRVELYGCTYEADTMHFNGSSLLAHDIRTDSVSSLQDYVRLRFKTVQPNSILMYSRGTQGDYLALQLVNNKLILSIDLGGNIMSTVSVGSLLDDNLWHDVRIKRDRNKVMLNVDRAAVIETIKGDYSRLDLNRKLYFGGVPSVQTGMLVRENFTGCLENIFINKTNVIRQLKTDNWRYSSVNTLLYCPEQQVIPITFLTGDSYVKQTGYEDLGSLNVSLNLRTYAEDGLLVYHQFFASGFVKLYLQKGKIKVDIAAEGMSAVTMENFENKLNDGTWHSVMLVVGKNMIIVAVDGRAMETNRLIAIRTGNQYYIGGGVHGEPGFVGCMRFINIDGNMRHPLNWGPHDFCCDDQIILDACQMVDRCSPNPCRHDAGCYQDSREFYCDCTGTGYSGAMCQASDNSLSCESHRQSNPTSKSAEIMIDIDGSGPLAPFPVKCMFYSDGRTVTILHHHSQEMTEVDGFDRPGSFVQDIIYDTEFGQILELVNRSTSCSQTIQYDCFNARLMNSPVSGSQKFEPMSWWVSRNNQKMDYWGGALPGSFMCECGLSGLCADNSKWCNCDAGLDTWLSDKGELTLKQHLPVRQLRFGDTGTPLDKKKGRFFLGPLKCEGDFLYDNTVTFRRADASVDFPTFDMGHGGDIYLEFKTTSSDTMVLLHSKGPEDYIKITLIGGDQIQLNFDAGNGPSGVNVEVSGMNDDRWHSLLVERNRKEARVVIDGSTIGDIQESRGPSRAIYLTSKLVIGSTVDYTDGFVGCMRALMINGQIYDMRTPAERGLYGVMPGCVGKCSSNPCLNNGTCYEGYSTYKCDCRWTAFKGPICADEIGVNMQTDYMIKYDFLGNYKSTIAEQIRVGFSTTDPRGILLAVTSGITKEYLTLMVSNSGHLRLVFDFGFERQEIIYPDRMFNQGQFHDVSITRAESGTKLIMKVDNYKALEIKFNVSRSADAQFNNIQYMYIGKNETMKEGFIGCISRVQFDDIFLLKQMFQEDRPPNVKPAPENILEDFCGIEPVTHPQEIEATRPAPQVDQDKIDALTYSTDSAVLGGVLAVLFIALVVMAIIIGRYLSRHKGEYLTQEDEGAKDAPDADFAVIRSSTGPHVEKKKEWFI